MKIVDEGSIKVRKPAWLKRSLPSGPEYGRMKNLIKNSSLATVCQEAQCPNQFECFSKGTATFMILGDRCTRNCGFCAVSYKPLTLPDAGEPLRVAEAVAVLKLKFAVITSVTRDDLADGGASHFAQTIREIRRRSPVTRIEILIPDLQGNWQALEEILENTQDCRTRLIATDRVNWSGSILLTLILFQLTWLRLLLRFQNQSFFFKFGFKLFSCMP